MDICGIQNLTLLDYPGKVACTVFTSGCNFKCPYCHNWCIANQAGGVMGEVITEEWFLNDFLTKMHGKLDGVCISGGEPTLQKDLVDFIIKVKDAGHLVKLDTNGSRCFVLDDAIKFAQVDYVAMDIKSSPGKYASACGLQHVNIDAIRKSIDLIKSSAADYEFRTTLVDELHDAYDIEQMGKIIAGAKKWYLQSFVDSPCVPRRGFHAPSAEKMSGYLEIAKRYVEHAEIRGGLN